MLTTTALDHRSLRDQINNAYRMDETACINLLLLQAEFSPQAANEISTLAKQLVQEARQCKQLSKINELLLEYNLSTDEGIALMCLAEALLRIPDQATMDKFIADKISTIDWKKHLETRSSFFMNATSWSLLMTGKIYAPILSLRENLWHATKSIVSRLGIAVIRPIILRIMKMISEEFIIGENITTALKNANKLKKLGYHFSFDMLGEAACTEEDAKKYYGAYLHAIKILGENSTAKTLEENHGISIKLSALHPRYEYSQRERVLNELPPLLLSLLLQAKKYQIRVIIDAEEADRLDLSLDIFATVFADPSLNNWEGFGLAIQAYQKRASFVIDWLIALSDQYKKRMIVRLVKGAYWDTEIKSSQVQGLDYPVFTRKNSTDVSYIVCAKKILAHPQHFYAQFGTHNAYSIAAILQITKHSPELQDHFEFQCLQGMGRQLYDQLVDQSQFSVRCRIYAPIGTHQDLLGYLVRRLLENGANNSFMNQLNNDAIPIEKIIEDPIIKISRLAEKPHPAIPSFKDLYVQWQNSAGVDLSNTKEFAAFKQRMTAFLKQPLPSIQTANEADVDQSLSIASKATSIWAHTSVYERTKIMEKAADLFQQAMPELVTLLTQEGHKCLLDAIAEVRETIDYCRYYSFRARQDLSPVIILPGPTGESNILSLHPRGIIACISPWNFPLAIFTGQIVAALVAGNVVIAKPAEQTPQIALKAVQILHQAGVPKSVLQLLIGPGSRIGAKIISDTRIAGVIFTGSTETAKHIEQTLAHRESPIALLIAETGGQNVMIVDSSILPEQTVIDIVRSAFNSAGQRCSALRVLFVQEEIAPKLLTMLKGYMAEIQLGDPQCLSTDIGPVTDESALEMLKEHFAVMDHEGTLIAQVPLQQIKPGNYFAPCVFEIKKLEVLKKEIFGPFLHIIRYQSNELDKVLESIINTGYGLTLGIQSRIDVTIDYIAKRLSIGNTYVNRNMIGAVVGVQPFGGERLSGTGPKAGGPHYLTRLCVERSISINTTAVGGNAHLVSLLEENE